MSVSVEYARKQVKNLLNPFEKEKWVIDQRILGSSNFNQTILYHAVGPVFDNQEQYDNFIQQLGKYFKSEGFQVGVCKMTNKTIPQLSCLVIRWDLT